MFNGAWAQRAFSWRRNREEKQQLLSPGDAPSNSGQSQGYTDMMWRSPSPQGYVAPVIDMQQEGAGQQDLAFASPFPPDAELQQQQGCGKLQHPGHRRASGGHPVPQDRAGSGIFSAQSDRALHKAWSAACIGRGPGGNAASECEHLLEHAATALPVMQPDSSQPSHSGTHASSRSHFSNFGSQISDLHSPLPVSTRPSRHRSSDEDLLGTATPWEEPRFSYQPLLEPLLQEDSQLDGQARQGHQEPGSMGSSPELRLPGRASAADHSHMHGLHQQALQHLVAGYGGQAGALGLLGSPGQHRGQASLGSVRSTGSEGHEPAGASLGQHRDRLLSSLLLKRTASAGSDTLPGGWGDRHLHRSISAKRLEDGSLLLQEHVVSPDGSRRMKRVGSGQLLITEDGGVMSPAPSDALLGTKPESLLGTSPSKLSRQTGASHSVLVHSVNEDGTTQVQSVPILTGQGGPPPDLQKVWRQQMKWVLLWLTLSLLTCLHSAALMLATQYNLFATVFGGMFCLSGILGMWGSLRTILGYCMVRQWNMSGTAMFKLKHVEVLAFTCTTVSTLAAVIHYISVNVIRTVGEGHLCDPADHTCEQNFNLIVITCVSTAVLYGVHALISGVLTYKTHCIRQLVRNMPQLDI
eukprot:jgi/Astpho2/7499/Aster-x1438